MAQKIKMADVVRLEDAIIEIGNIDEIKKFAKYVKGSRMKNFVLSF
jgi:hypothetical protein